ncbi:hypothetical protein [Streptomyces anulatus]|uniref:hypothetical protein n=1 Tax=Streptomyces anulatus TaxID=1892 RepID=UPI0038652AF8|nr:hypothetical protein OG865_28625 [Streptomyces anulatus]
MLVPADGWTQRLDILTKMRRSIGKHYGVRLRDEIKANYLLRSRGDLKRYGLGMANDATFTRRTLRHLFLFRLVFSL